jgi:hypothetical protein
VLDGKHLIKVLTVHAVQCSCCPTRRAFASGDAETTPKQKPARKADAPGGGSNERHHRRHKNAHVKRKEKKQ